MLCDLLSLTQIDRLIDWLANPALVWCNSRADLDSEKIQWVQVTPPLKKKKEIVFWNSHSVRRDLRELLFWLKCNTFTAEPQLPWSSNWDFDWPQNWLLSDTDHLILPTVCSKFILVVTKMIPNFQTELLHTRWYSKTQRYKTKLLGHN